MKIRVRRRNRVGRCKDTAAVKVAEVVAVAFGVREDARDEIAGQDKEQIHAITSAMHCSRLPAARTDRGAKHST